MHADPVRRFSSLLRSASVSFGADPNHTGNEGRNLSRQKYETSLIFHPPLHNYLTLHSEEQRNQRTTHEGAASIRRYISNL